MTEQYVMNRLLEKKQCAQTGKLLKDVKFNIAVEYCDIDNTTYYRLYRSVGGVRDKLALISSTDIYKVAQYQSYYNSIKEEM